MSFILFCVCLMGLQAWVEWRFYPCDRMHQACHCPLGRTWRRYEKAAPDYTVKIIRPPVDRIRPQVSMCWNMVLDYPSSIFPSPIEAAYKRAVIIEHQEADDLIWLRRLGDEIEKSKAPQIWLEMPDMVGFTHLYCNGCGELKILGEIHPNHYCFTCQPFCSRPTSGKSMELLDEEFVAYLERIKKKHGV